MKAFLALSALLAALVFVPSPAQSVDAGELRCVNYAYAADYNWYYLCWNARDLSCPVWTAHWNGYQFSNKECVVEGPTTTALSPRCVQYGQDLDYAHFVCYDLRDSECPVYLLRESSGHSVRTCLV